MSDFDLEDLRSATLSDDDDAGTLEDGPARSQKIMGMTTVEIAILAFFIFLNVVVIAFAILIFTGRINF